MRPALSAALVASLALSACKSEPPPAPAAAPPAPAAPPAAPAAAPAAPAAPLPERAVAITADDKGYTPSRIEAKPREPLLLKFTRTVEGTCADVVVIAGDPVKHVLPVGKTIEVRLTAPETGAIAFACGMSMFKGSIVVAQ